MSGELLRAMIVRVASRITLGAQGRRREIVVDVPAVGRADLLLVVVAARRVRQRAAALALRLGDRVVGVERLAGLFSWPADNENK